MAQATRASGKHARAAENRPLRSLQGRIVAILLVVSLLPLVITGAGAWVVFGRLLVDKSLELQAEIVQAHASALEDYLTYNLRALELAARTHGLEEIGGQEGLQKLFDGLNGSHDNAFVDIGVIGSDGEHLAYVGPYDLMNKNYSKSEWFGFVTMQGAYVSDVFLGFRGVPHCVMAVRRQEGLRSWILRATVNSDKFDTLVHTTKLGATGDSFIVNGAGTYQTPPRSGKVLDVSPFVSPIPHKGVRESRVERDGRNMIQTTAWINHDRWMLVVHQDEAEIMAPLQRALTLGGLVVALSVILLVFTTYAATRHLTGQIASAHEERERMASDLMRSAKLASLGEMSTGLAHEINNPLAIISTELTNISDVTTLDDPENLAKDDILESVKRCMRQVARCSAITSKMLQFGRQTASSPRPTDIGPRLAEITELMGKQASIRNVRLTLEIEPSLPAVNLDPTELQQVLVNLINNGMQAITGPGTIDIRARQVGREVQISVRDSGSGIAPEHLDRIFQPFFSTKPVGKGTGLGLSVCYGIVTAWGGTIEVESKLGSGTTMILHLPAAPGQAGSGGERAGGQS